MEAVEKINEAATPEQWEIAIDNLIGAGNNKFAVAGATVEQKAVWNWVMQELHGMLDYQPESVEENTPLREYREDDMEEIADELEEIKAQIENLMHEAGNLIDQTDERHAARSYWYGHIMGALDNNSEYLGGSMTTMQDSIDAIRESNVDADEDGYDEDGYDRDGAHRDDKFDDPNPRGATQ